MTLDSSLSRLSDLTAYLGRPRSFLVDCLRAFLIAYKVEEKSPRYLEGLERRILDFCHFAEKSGLPQKVEEIGPLHIRAYLAHLQDRGLAATTRHSHYRALHAFFNWLVGEGYIARSPFINISPPKLPKRVVPVFTKEQIDQLLYLCPPTTFLGARNRAIILTLLGTGIRKRELVEMRLQDIDLDHEWVMVQGKGAKERRVYVSKTVQRAILHYLSFRNDKYEALWVSEERKPMTEDGMRETIYKLGKRAGINGVRCSAHTFRHTFAVNFLRNGGNLRHLQEILGHANMKALEFYLTTINCEDGMVAHRMYDPLHKWGVK